MESGLIFMSEHCSIGQPLISATEASERAALYCVDPGKGSTQTTPLVSHPPKAPMWLIDATKTFAARTGEALGLQLFPTFPELLYGSRASPESVT